jgi:hypothetical protein
MVSSTLGKKHGRRLGATGGERHDFVLQAAHKVKARPVEVVSHLGGELSLEVCDRNRVAPLQHRGETLLGLHNAVDDLERRSPFDLRLDRHEQARGPDNGRRGGRHYQSREESPALDHRQITMRVRPAMKAA